MNTVALRLPLLLGCYLFDFFVPEFRLQRVDWPSNCFALGKD